MMQKEFRWPIWRRLEASLFRKTFVTTTPRLFPIVWIPVYWWTCSVLETIQNKTLILTLGFNWRSKDWILKFKFESFRHQNICLITTGGLCAIELSTVDAMILC
eukprot:GHVP01008724.1.p1 GENE.GHVP01008724.1~~GHVP01008724.1.p1  ORF type:complete len:104 (+),score=6.58 GHVP01008724.1:22-333(+)